MCERNNTKSKCLSTQWLDALNTSTMGLKWCVVLLHLQFATFTEEQISERELLKDFLFHMGHIQASQFASRTKRVHKADSQATAKGKSVPRAYNFFVQGGKKPFGRWRASLMNLGGLNVLPKTSNYNN